MSNKTREKTLPKWFKGLLYTDGGRVTNKFSGAEYDLSPVDLSMYDFIMGTQLVLEMAPYTVTQAQVSDFHKALSWFRKNNPRAYMVLLD